MTPDFSRRTLMKGICSTAALSASAVLPAAGADGEYKGPHGPGMPQEGPNTPKLCAPLGGPIKVENLPTVPEEGAHSNEELWKNITYFLQAVIPACEQSNVRLALHPNDPPIAMTRGSGQIMASLDGWRKLITIVNSPANGITYECGVSREMEVDPVEVCQYFGTRDRINHVHYRNPVVRVPHNDYTETFIDQGENNMLAVMRELIKVKYTRLICPEHERALDYDRAVGVRNQYPGGGGYTGMVFDIAYARAMFQASIMLEQGTEWKEF